MLRLKLFVVLIGTFLRLFNELFVLFDLLLDNLFGFSFLFSLMLFSKFWVFLCNLFLMQLFLSMLFSSCPGCPEFCSLRGGCFLLFGQVSLNSSLLCPCKGLLLSFLCCDSLPLFISLPFFSCRLLSCLAPSWRLLSWPAPSCRLLSCSALSGRLLSAPIITFNLCLSEAGWRWQTHIGFDFSQSLTFRAH